MPAAFSAPAAGPTIIPDISCLGFEVTQAIQNMAHEIPLIAKKATVVRAYLDNGDANTWTLDGEIMMRPVGATGPNGGWTYIQSISPVDVDPAENGQLRSKRENAAKSMNFRVPETLLAPGQYEIKLLQVQPVGSPQQKKHFPSGGERSIELIESPPLRLHVVGIRYAVGTPAQTFTPTARDFALLRSWLIRAYPVSDVFWTQAVVDYSGTWNSDAGEANAFVAGLRALDVANGTDQRTHYYGFVHDGGGFMRGLADGIPGTPDPSIVASGPTGPGTFGWDTDGSYGDWYGGHELAHTLGRAHAPFCGAGGGVAYPFPAGQLSTNDGAWVGFDAGDPSNAIAMQALPGTTYHDVMTYCSFQWLSSFTYNAIRERLVAEDALAAGPVPTGGPGAGPAAAPGGSPMVSSIHVISSVNLTKQTAKILQVNAGSAPLSPLPDPTATPFALRTLKSDGSPLQDYPILLRPHGCIDAGQDETATLEIVIPNSAEIGGLMLLHDGQTIDRYEPGSISPMKPKNLQAESAAMGLGFAPAGVATSIDPVITWEDDAISGPIPPGSALPKYTVQLSTDDGKSWRAIGLGLLHPKVSIDRHLLSGVNEVQLKVTSTNGFKTQSVIKKFATKDL